MNRHHLASLACAILFGLGACSETDTSPGRTLDGSGGTGGVAPGGGLGGTGGLPLTCAAGQAPCNGVCVDTLYNPVHCGACGVVCPPGQSCNGGICGCPAGQLACSSGCVDPLTSPTHCGACEVACAPLQSCVAGRCECQPGLLDCGAGCTNLLSDPAHCGACGNVCVAPTPYCSAGLCSAECGAGLTSCGNSCVDVRSDAANCGQCGVQCPAGQSCTNGLCGCPAGQADCGAGCVDILSNLAHCGACQQPCTGGALCTAGTCACPAGSLLCAGTCVVGTSCPCNPACTGGKACVAGSCACPSGTEDCNGTCVTAGTCTTATCNPACTGGKECQDGTCTCPAGTEDCDGTCVATGTCAATCSPVCTGGKECVAGSCVCPSGTIDCSGTCVTGSTCSTDCTTPVGMISNFEEGSAVSPAVVIAQDGRQGVWERFYETDTPNFNLAVESTGGSDSCDRWALRATGSAAAGWGGWVGIGLNLTGTETNPNQYDASKYTGIRFKARRGPGHDAKSAVRFNVSIPETEGTGSPGDHDSCTDQAGTTEKAARPCYQHLGRFLHVVNGYESTDYVDTTLTTDWKTFSFCFDRDLYPLSLPSNLSKEERGALASRILKLQFQFNQGKDWYVTTYPNEGQYTELQKTLPFDFWINDLEFFAGECPNAQTFTSSAGTAKAFPQNANTGACTPAANAAAFNNAISQIYERWTRRFVVTDGGGARVIAPEQENGVTTSESMGYGMLIAAAMGDKTAFDRFWTYVSDPSRLVNGLMVWKPSGGSGSATDGDVDIAYALKMADAQWGGYATAANAMIGAIQARDVDPANNHLKAGDSWDPGFNPSYFAPSYFRAFGGMDAVIETNYSILQTNITATTSGFPTDWADWTGQPVSGSDIGAQVTAGFTEPAYGYDAARVPWRIGLDGCKSGGTGITLATTIVSYFASRYDSGATIDLMKAGWLKSSGAVAATARDFQGSFIGPLGVGAMAAGNPDVRDRAFRAILDILENGDFNHTYFPSTVGFITLLIMSGNFPGP